MQLTERHREYWRKNLTITAILLAIWFVVTYVVGFFARELNTITLFWQLRGEAGARSRRQRRNDCACKCERSKCFCCGRCNSIKVFSRR